MYKRYFIWIMGVYSHIPGFRWYGKTVLRSIETRGFWRTWLINYVVSVIVTLASWKLTAWAVNRLVENVDAEKDWDDLWARYTSASESGESMYASLHD